MADIVSALKPAWPILSPFLLSPHIPHQVALDAHTAVYPQQTYQFFLSTLKTFADH